MKRNSLTKEEARAFSENLKNWQIKEDLSGRELAQLLDVSEGYVSALRTGKYNASLDLVKKLSKLANISTKVLITDPEEAVWEERRVYGRSCRKQRLALGYSKKQVCDFVGFGTNRVLDDFENGRCSTTEEQREKLDKLLFPPIKVVAEAKPEPVQTMEMEPEKDSKEVNAMPTKACNIPYEIIDVVLKHVKDLNVSEDIQRKIFRSLSEYLTTLREEALFG